MLPDALREAGASAGALLKERGETIAVAEGSCGGLVSAALLAVPGASAYYLGGAVIYTGVASKAYMKGEVDIPPGMRGASEPFVTWLAQSCRRKLDATWGIGEGGATGPSGNPYGDPPGHVWMAVDGPGGTATRHLLTGDDDRERNMVAFAVAALDLLRERLSAAG